MLGKIEDINLNRKELNMISKLLDSIMGDSQTIEIEPFLRESFLLAHSLPARLKRFLYQFKLEEKAPGVRIRHTELPFVVEPTPLKLPENRSSECTRAEALHILYASVIGEVFAWDSIQNGNLVNQVLPLPEHSQNYISSGSKNLFDLHTEDAFHPYAEEYLCLLCMRNPQKIPTIIACIADVELPLEVKESLFQPQFFIGANLAHNVEQPTEKTPVLFGHRDAPYLRLNTNVEDANMSNTPASFALAKLVEKLHEVEQLVVLEAGDVLFLDNYRVAHGRPPYSPTYRGSDRWLKRLYITTNLKKSRDLRDSATSRLIKSAGMR